MVRAISVVALAVVLAGCGKAAGPSQTTTNAACALIAQPEQLFGAGAEIVGANDIGAGSCHFGSQDGRRGGDIIVFDGTAAATQYRQLAQKWAEVNRSPLQSVPELGDEAQLAGDLPGYQTQIVLRKGQSTVALLAWSGDPQIGGDDLALRMATAVAQALPASGLRRGGAGKAG
ncbi:MAG TPA: hypothetical protein VG841_11550 [Caulobacterales bacterium]|nr:hypothetical protein [Caulobacterales bacterium]